jgi:hypothetical protein
MHRFSARLPGGGAADCVYSRWMLRWYCSSTVCGSPAGPRDVGTCSATDGRSAQALQTALCCFGLTDWPVETHSANARQRNLCHNSLQSALSVSL